MVAPRNFDLGRWIKVKQYVFNRDDWTCLLCGQRGGWKVAHHTSYQYGYYNPQWIVTLCDDETVNCCHSVLHSFDIKHRIRHGTSFDIDVVRKWEQHLGIKILS